MMKAPALPFKAGIALHPIDEFLNTVPRYSIAHVCWLNTEVIPKVEVAAAYTKEALLFKYYITETTHRATYQLPNEPVFKDSCVELFIAVDDSGNYYNFEFNSLGTCLASYGKDRNNRLKLTPEVIAKICRQIKWVNYSPSKHQFDWELTLIFPAEAFCFHQVKYQPSQQFRVNFYKCGDELPEPHYLAWNPVRSEVMDFHQPRFFGLLQLV